MNFVGQRIRKLNSRQNKQISFLLLDRDTITFDTRTWPKDPQAVPLCQR